MTQTKPAHTDLSIDEMPWPEFIDPPPTDLPYDDGEPMESPWHAASGPLLKASYVARQGRYLDVIVELLSTTTEREDLGPKKRLYEQVFRTTEYFCVAPQVERLLGGRLTNGHYKAIKPDPHGRLWSQELDLWLGPWRSVYLGEEHTWLRFYTNDGALVSLPEEAKRARAETERQRADDLATRLAILEDELRGLRGEETQP